MPDGSKAASNKSFVDQLLRPACYPHPTDTIERLETHISWVLLAGDFAYKIKKPVSLGFVDFSTLQSRRHFCEEELRLNRRTAPDLYLDVVPITGTAEDPRMGGTGAAIDYAVKMHRFPQEALLDRVAKAGDLTTAQVEAFARSVAGFHERVARADADGAFGSPREILAEAVDNFAQLEHLDQPGDTREARQALCSWTLQEFNRLEGAFARRRHDGFVRECHGDLHLGNVALLAGEPVAFDAIEFNAGFRWIDVMNEVAFPVMDLVHHGLPRLAHRFIDAYLDETGDFAGLKVLRFYLVYRAMVRAKVSGIRAHQPGIGEDDRERSARACRGHLELALRLSRHGHPALIAMHGLSGSGKTTVSEELVDALGAVRLRSDVERKRLYGLERDAHAHAAPGDGIYTPEADRITYARLASLAEQVLEAECPVIVDAAFLKLAWRKYFREFARTRGAPFVLVACAAPEAVLRERVAHREQEGADASDAGIEVLERQLASIEPLTEEEQVGALIVETAETGSPGKAIRDIATRLRITPA